MQCCDNFPIKLSHYFLDLYLPSSRVCIQVTHYKNSLVSKLAHENLCATALFDSALKHFDALEDFPLASRFQQAYFALALHYCYFQITLSSSCLIAYLPCTYYPLFLDPQHPQYFQDLGYFTGFLCRLNFLQMALD